MEATWRHRPDDRPSFSQLVGLLEEARPDQLQAVLPASTRGHGLLDYSQGEIITVLDKQPQLQAGLAIKKPTQKKPPKKTTKNGFFGFC